MSIKIIADSSCDMPKELRQENPFVSVPFKLYIDEEEIIDDEQLDVISFIDKMVKSTGVPRSACPAPNDFLIDFSGVNACYVVAISSRLSGTYNSAELAKTMYLEENPNKLIHVFDSKSASIAEALIVLKIHELNQLKISHADIVDQVTQYISEMKTYFVSESLDNLIKNGRISKLKGAIANVLNIKPIMGPDEDGEIKLIDKARGTAKAFQTMTDLIVENAQNAENRILAISHVNNLERATWLKEEIEKKCQFKQIVIVQTGGLSSLYCDNHGIILAF